MNKKILLFSASLGMVYLTISGNSAGPATMGNGNISGSAGSGTANCSGASCHPAGNAANTLASTSQGIVTVHTSPTGSASSMLVGGYVPGTKYYVRLGAKNNNGLTKFGFQASCVSGTSTKVNAGTLAALPSSNTVLKTGTINVIEHTKALDATMFEFVSIFEWTAPAAGTGDVTFYAMVNAVNGNGATTGDQPSIGMTKTYYEKTTSIGEINNNIVSKIYPNPCNNLLNIETAGTAKFMSTVYDLAGRQVIAPSHQNNIDVSALAPGVYLLRLNTEDGQQTATFVKQ